MSSHPPASAADVDQAVRVQVFRHTAQTARVPRSEEIAAALALSPVGVEDALRRLAANRLLVLAPATTNVWIAPPFCAVPTDFRVQADGRTYWAICIWDALGIPAALQADATITARCGDCGNELGLDVRQGRLVRSEGIVHFAVPAVRWWENLAFA